MGKLATIERLQSMIDAVSAQDETAFDVVSGGLRDASRPKATRKRRKSPSPDDDGIPPAKKAYNRVIELCGYHDFSCAKMRERLKREGLPADAVEDAIEKAVRIGLIDDLRWGEMRASALMRRGMGRMGIVRELKENGISAHDIDGWPEEYEERFGDELQRALGVLEKNPPRSKNLRASAYGKLMRKGYDSSVSAQASGIWFARQYEGNE
ncbi:MAG: RecX family transcriptional regulator [Coriobacteriia bacterium]|nr:RecX family transcriptional regulator [Coriobacteriia bacterium]